MLIEQRPITSREEWLAWRREDVTASTIGALFNCHPYCTALKLFVEKRGVEFPEEDTKAMRRGRWLEPAVAKAVNEKRPEWTLEYPNVYLRDIEAGIGATPDYYITNDPRGRGVLQIKTVAWSVFRREWDEGREVPFWITLQCLTEMMLSDAAFGAVAVLLVDAHQMDVWILEIPRNEAAERKIVQAVEAFWKMVDEGREPQPDFDRDDATIKALTAKETPGKQIDLGGHNELPVLLEQRAQLMERIEADEARKTAIETEIKFLMQDAELVTGLRDWRITYKSSDYKSYTVPARRSRVLRIFDKRETTP